MKIIIRILCIFCLFSFLFGQVSYNRELQVNTYINYSQEVPCITNLTDSGFVICWASWDQDGSGFGIYGQVYNKDYSKRGTEFQVNTYTDGSQDNPNISSLYGGGFVVCWQSDGQDGSDYGIYGQVYNEDGSKRGSEFQVNTYTDNKQEFPNISSLYTGGFVVCWESWYQDGSGSDIYCQIYNEDGSQHGSEFKVNTNKQDYQSFPSVSSLSNGNFVVCWESSQSSLFCGQIYNEDGSRLDMVNTYEYQDHPCVANLKDGGFVVCWQSYGLDDSLEGIYGQIYNEDGSRRGIKFHVNTYTVSLQVRPNVSSLSDGGFVVCWQSNEQDGSGPGIYCQVYNEHGSQRGIEFQVNTYSKSSQWDPCVRGLSDGSFVVCWASYQDGSDDGIFAKYYTKEINHSLVTYSLIEPGDDETIKTQEYIFNWQQASDIRINLPWELEYGIYIDGDENFSNPRIISAIYDTTCIVDSLTPGTLYYWKVLAKNIAGDSLWSSETNAFFVSHDAASGIEDENPGIINSFKLYQNYPNPFNSLTKINFYLPTPECAKIEIINSVGQIIEIITDKNLVSGYHSVSYDASFLSSGIYFYKIKAGVYTATKKMVLIK